MSQEDGTEGGFPDADPSAPTESVSVDHREGMIAPGQVLGDRYHIHSPLGRGGMGEVWRAFDLKLRVEVALKALRKDLFRDERRLGLLRREVRSAREVLSPNVCRIFDLIEVDGSELVSMEYVDGRTLLQVLQKRGPLDLKEAQDIASQFLAGLEAIHKVGLVHRDVKPENIMITRAGRVVLMDFGLARQEDSGSGTVAGTPAYMAPEQAAGQKVDARADVYAAGVVLAEMVSPEGIKSLDSRKSLWKGVRSDPAQLPDTPWAPVLKKAVAKEPDRRYNSAHTLTRALEDVTLRVEGAEDLNPYPGLAAFTEEDAEYFFGREAEVEQMWRTIEGPARLLGLVGPSGAGKTSFVRAGLIPGAGASWSIVRFTPGNAPFVSLGQALAPETAGDPDAMRLLPRIQEIDAAVELVSRWCRRGPRALLVVDQFEELFTQNPPEIQNFFAGLLARLPLEAEAHVLLSMRDDFLMECNRYEVLRPIVAGLTLLAPPTGANLRRALVQPAMKCGYRFEDDELVEEMLAEVEGERGALPLLAFAMSRLWEKRDRENGLLTRQAYHDIGGVGGALARHAEATIGRIGAKHVSVVRELFRNLVTAEGTRAVHEWDELLTVFDDPHRPSAEEVLRELIDARLLTSYEVQGEDREPTRRVEIIHEALLETWPRLVGWRTQDADSARLRDELRQAARTWGEHDRSDDRLWTGTAYREFQVWHERYPGGLSELEEEFAHAMTSSAGRRNLRRRIAAVVVLFVVVAVAAVTTTLWRRSVLQERRAEAQKLIAFGKVRLKDYPTAALAHATQSLELADSEEARFLALEALWEGPTAFVVNEDPTLFAVFSPGGKWLVQSHDFMSSLAVVSRNGSQQHLEHPTDSGQTRVVAIFGGSEDLFVSMGAHKDMGRIALWSAPEGRMLASAKPVDEPRLNFYRRAIGADVENPRGLFVLPKEDLVTVAALYADGRHEVLGTFRMKIPIGQGGEICIPWASGDWIGVVEDDDISVIGVGPDGLSDRRLLGRHEAHRGRCVADPQGRFFLTFAWSGEIRRWDVNGDRPPMVFDGPEGLRSLHLSKDGSHVFAKNSPEKSLVNVWIWQVDELTFNLRRRLDRVKNPDGFWAFDPAGLHIAMAKPIPVNRLWSLEGPAGAEPIRLRRGSVGFVSQPEFSPDGRWIATSDQAGLTMWPLARPYAAVIPLDLEFWVGGVDFGPEGRFLATSADSDVAMWPLEGEVPPAGHTVFETTTRLLGKLAVAGNGEWFAVASNRGTVWIGGDDGEEPRELPGTDMSGSADVAFSADGRFVASLTGIYDMESAVTRVWDVATTQEVAVLRLADNTFRRGSSFASDGRLLTATSKGVVAWDVETGDHETLVDLDVGRFVASDDGRRVMVTEFGKAGNLQDPAGSPVFVDLDTGRSTVLATHGMRVVPMALNREGTVAVTGDKSGIIRVGPVKGEEPHLLLGHVDGIRHVAIDPLGRWIASAGEDRTVRLWPMPDPSKPPLHTLPRDELIAKLKTLTNLRIVRDEESATGWKLTHDPFPGWETVPTW